LQDPEGTIIARINELNEDLNLTIDKVSISVSHGSASIRGKVPYYFTNNSIYVTFSFEGQQALSDVITVTDLGQFV
jgi:hypothetical protein